MAKVQVPSRRGFLLWLFGFVAWTGLTLWITTTARALALLPAGAVASAIVVYTLSRVAWPPDE